MDGWMGGWRLFWLLLQQEVLHVLLFQADRLVDFTMFHPVGTDWLWNCQPDRPGDV